MHISNKEEKVLAAKVAREVGFFKPLNKDLVSIGFTRITPELLTKIWKEGGFIPPDVPKVSDVKERISYVRFWGRYAVYVHTRHLVSSKRISEHGYMSVVVSRLRDKGDDRIVIRYVQYDERGMYVRRLVQFAQFFNLLLENQPQTKKNNWAILKETSHEVYNWTNRRGKVIQPFSNDISEKMFPLVRRALRSNRLYHRKYREQLGVARYRRDIVNHYQYRKK